MGKSRARVPSYYRQSIQNAVNRQINLGRTKTAASLNREAIGQVVSYCFVAALGRRQGACIPRIN